MSANANYLYSLSVSWLPPESPYWRLESDVRLALARELDNQIPSRNEIAQAYEALVADRGMSSKRRIPVQSLYEPWTLDPDCNLAFARARGLRRGDAALHMDHVLTALGIELPHELGLDSDHIAVILNVTGVIAERFPEKLGSFAVDHLAWFEEYAQQTNEAWDDDSGADYYRALIRATAHAAEPLIAAAQRNAKGI